MANDEFVKLGRLGCVWRACSDCQKQVTKLLASGDHEKLQGVDHHIGLAAIRQMELDRHAMRVRGIRTVRYVWDTGGSREPHGDRNCPAAKNRRFAERLTV